MSELNNKLISWAATFNAWRVFPRVFISTYLWLLHETTMWFMALPDPSMAQSGLISVVIGAGAAWFGLYVSSGSGSKSNITIEQPSTASKSTLPEIT